MRGILVALFALPLGCASTPPDNTETIEALIEDGKTRPLSQVAVSVDIVATEMPDRTGVYRVGIKDVLRFSVA